MNERLSSEISAEVDSIIVEYESGEIEQALARLRTLGFSAGDIHRLLNRPDSRRQYINDRANGF